jgi:hypothetical protein
MNENPNKQSGYWAVVTQFVLGDFPLTEAEITGFSQNDDERAKLSTLFQNALGSRWSEAAEQAVDMYRAKK